MRLRSPRTGRHLVADTPHSLAAPGERWPVVEGIPYLRIGSEELVEAALGHLDAGRHDDALMTLLTDQDAWWTGPATDAGEIERLVRDRDTLTLREAMALLRMGPVADYFAYRWSDPTYLAGLALIEAHWAGPTRAFELACGIGHYLRELSRSGVACTGADIVFSKCWLAKHWVAPDADYVVFDAAAAWPVADERYDLVMCHDAFYFLPDQHRIAADLRNAVAADGMLVVSHLHNADVAGGAKGPARSAGEWHASFGGAQVYDERALLSALMEKAIPAPTLWSADGTIEAWSIVETDRLAKPVIGGIAMPPTNASLRANPLLAADGSACWPSPRYRDEYAAGCYWAMPGGGPFPYADDARLRRVVDLPERW